MQHQIKEAPALSDLDRTFPPELAKVVAKMMRKRPADRYQTPGEVMAALGPWLPNTSAVVSALSRTENRDSRELQQTLSEVVTGSTKRLPGVPAPARPPERPRVPLLAFVAAGVVIAAFGLVGLGALAAYALSGSSDKSAAAAQPFTPAAAVPGAGKPPARGPALFRFDADGLAPFREQWRTAPGRERADWHDNVVLGGTGEGKLPEGWQRMSYKVGTVSEVAVDEVAGARALGVATLEGERSTMLFTPKFATGTAALRVRVEYLTEGDAGAAILKFRQTGPPSSADGWDLGKLTATGGRWAQREFPLAPRGADQGLLEFHTGYLDLGKGLWVKSLTVFPAAAGE